jgi:hypothetical protein
VCIADGQPIRSRPDAAEDLIESFIPISPEALGLSVEVR